MWKNYQINSKLVKHWGGSIMIWKMDGVKYGTILEDNLSQPARGSRLGRRFIFQQDNDPKRSA